MTKAIKTMEELHLEGVSSSLLSQIARALEKRAFIKMKEDKLKSEKEAANDLAQDAFERAGISGFKQEGVGSLSMVTATRSSLNKDKLKQVMAESGIAVSEINRIVALSSTETTSISIQFRETK